MLLSERGGEGWQNFCSVSVTQDLMVLHIDVGGGGDFGSARMANSLFGITDLT